MRLLEFGQTGLQVTPIGLGTAALGRPGYINLGHAGDLEEDYNEKRMEERTHAVLTEAYQLGIRYFDTARSYGKGEKFLGRWLKRHNHHFPSLVTGSKWGYTYTANWQVEAKKHEIKEHSKEVLERQWEESKQNLGANLKLYQIHSATLESGVLKNKQVLYKLWAIKEEGTKIGLSLSGVGQSQTLNKALKISNGNRKLFDSVQATWNFLEPSVGPDLQKAHDEGLGIIVKEALANGRLTDRNQDQKFQEKKKLLQQVASSYQTSLDAVAMAMACQQAWSDVVLSGAATAEQLRSNIRSRELTLENQDLKKLLALKEPPEEYWGTRSALPWN